MMEGYATAEALGAKLSSLGLEHGWFDAAMEQCTSVLTTSADANHRLCKAAAASPAVPTSTAVLAKQAAHI